MSFFAHLGRLPIVYYFEIVVHSFESPILTGSESAYVIIKRSNKSIQTQVAITELKQIKWEQQLKLQATLYKNKKTLTFDKKYYIVTIKQQNQQLKSPTNQIILPQEINVEIDLAQFVGEQEMENTKTFHCLERKKKNGEEDEIYEQTLLKLTIRSSPQPFSNSSPVVPHSNSAPQPIPLINPSIVPVHRLSFVSRQTDEEIKLEEKQQRQKLEKLYENDGDEAQNQQQQQTDEDRFPQRLRTFSQIESDSDSEQEDETVGKYSSAPITANTTATQSNYLKTPSSQQTPTKLTPTNSNRTLTLQQEQTDTRSRQNSTHKQDETSVDRHNNLTVPSSTSLSAPISPPSKRLSVVVPEDGSPVLQTSPAIPSISDSPLVMSSFPPASSLPLCSSDFDVSASGSPSHSRSSVHRQPHTRSVSMVVSQSSNIQQTTGESPSYSRNTSKNHSRRSGGMANTFPGKNNRRSVTQIFTSIMVESIVSPKEFQEIHPSTANLSSLPSIHDSEILYEVQTPVDTTSDLNDSANQDDNNTETLQRNTNQSNNHATIDPPLNDNHSVDALTRTDQEEEQSQQHQHDDTHELTVEDVLAPTFEGPRPSSCSVPVAHRRSLSLYGGAAAGTDALAAFGFGGKKSSLFSQQRKPLIQVTDLSAPVNDSTNSHSAVDSSTLHPPMSAPIEYTPRTSKAKSFLQNLMGSINKKNNKDDPVHSKKYGSGKWDEVIQAAKAQQQQHHQEEDSHSHSHLTRSSDDTVLSDHSTSNSPPALNRYVSTPSLHLPSSTSSTTVHSSEASPLAIHRALTPNHRSRQDSTTQRRQSKFNKINYPSL